MNISGVNHSELRRTYRITPIQHPLRSAAFEGAYLSRLPLSPPLIIQLDCWDSQGELMIPYDELPFLVCHLSLQTPEGHDAAMIQSPEGELVSMLYGTLVATPSEMLDRAGASGVYFAFPDVSVRHVGRFRLKINVMRITGGQPLDTTYTEPFDVVDASEYTAPDVTDLTRHFDAQGVIRFGLPRSEW
ncbi:velvet factor [Papiliotrema laurentii]|uniref:Velvet factor n=1 Tax=Papiliotrema laurentii TaxID=5418 RepID=A0AAD9CUS4_PAPLA|nr:velvet factor [Papiliotrema laurentii]